MSALNNRAALIAVLQGLGIDHHMLPSEARSVALLTAAVAEHAQRHTRLTGAEAVNFIDAVRDSLLTSARGLPRAFSAAQWLYYLRHSPYPLFLGKTAQATNSNYLYAESIASTSDVTHPQYDGQQTPEPGPIGPAVCDPLLDIINVARRLKPLQALRWRAAKGGRDIGAQRLLA